MACQVQRTASENPTTDGIVRLRWLPRLEPAAESSEPPSERFDYQACSWLKNTGCGYKRDSHIDAQRREEGDAYADAAAPCQARLSLV